MATSRFCMTLDDSASFVSFLIERYSSHFVPDRSVSPPPFPRYTSLAEVESQIDTELNVCRFHVLSPQWEQFPLVMQEINANDGQQFFAVSLRCGGPSFDLLLSRAWTDGVQKWIVAGHFVDYSHYIVDHAFLTDPALYRTVQRPASMELAHKDVRNYFRRNGCRSVCREEGHTGPWILSGALKQYESGIWLREGDWHYDPTRNASRTRRST